MKRLVFAITMALFFFVLLDLVYFNLGDGAFGYEVSFRFYVPYLIDFRSNPIPVGFLMLAAFSIGMISIALLEALPSFYKSLELRAKNKRIRQLERELKLVRQLAEKQHETPAPSEPSQESDRMS